MRKSVLMGLGLALSVAGTAIAQQRGQDTLRAPRGERGGRMEGRGGPGRMGPGGLLLKDITLTEAQRTQLAALAKTQREQMQSAREKNRGQMDDLKAARQRGDTAAVRKAFEARRAEMERERAQHVAAIRNVLTADQRVQFDKNVAELKQREAERGQRGKDVGARGGKRGEKPFRGGR